jgi:hypothetical protein
VEPNNVQQDQIVSIVQVKSLSLCASVYRVANRVANISMFNNFITRKEGASTDHQERKKTDFSSIALRKSKERRLGCIKSESNINQIHITIINVQVS